MPQKILCRLAIVTLFATCGMANAQKVRISAWYWLNSAPKVTWQGDFVTMKNMGFTDVVLSWGIDVSACSYRTADTKYAIREAHAAGLGAYLVIWQPVANTLTRKPNFQQVDSAGHELYSFDVFNPAWRDTEWKKYLQSIAFAYHEIPGFAGYVLDDSFLEGPIEHLGGARGTGTVSYGEFEKKHFTGDLPRSTGDLRWPEWVSARENWWVAWAQDTVNFIRQIDPDKAHQIYVEDPAGNALNPNLKNTIGLDFGRVAKYFDAVGAYSSFGYSAGSDNTKEVTEKTHHIIAEVQNIIGPSKGQIYTFWVADSADELKPGPAIFPTVDQIKSICQAALESGVHHLDMYGFRIGDYRVSAEDFQAKSPGRGAIYPLTGQFPQKFLWDRPEIESGLAQYLLSLNR